MLDGYKFDKSSGEPIYKQLLSELVGRIEAGELKPGAKLPTERELSERLGVSRGTVKSTYAALNRRNLVDVVQGSGTFVRKAGINLGGSDAELLILELHNNLIAKGFSPDEIYPMVESVLLKAGEKTQGRPSIAAVDCNQETLSIFRNQLLNFGGINYRGFLLRDVARYGKRTEIFAGYDLIFTTTTHYAELSELFEPCASRLTRVAVAPDRETILGLSKISEGRDVCVLTQSARFGEIISNYLKAISIEVPAENFFLMETIAPADFKAFIARWQYLVIPPFHSMKANCKMLMDILDYNSNTGKIIIFNYTIEKGSLIYFEETLKLNLSK